MKVYSRVVIDMISMEVVEEDFTEYSGDMVLCKGGGGGSSSGSVDYPVYMKTIHGDWLDRAGASTVAAGESVNELIHAGVANSPFAGELAYDPDNDIAAFLAAMADYSTDVDAINPTVDWANYVDLAITKIGTDLYSETEINAVTAAHGAILDDRLTTEVLPRFQAGMRDVNAVISSSFVVGQAVLEGFNTREVAEFDAKLRAQNYSEKNRYIMQSVQDNMRMGELLLKSKDSYARALIEAYRIKAVLKKEELTEQLDIDVKDYKWGLELYQFGGNILSSISGSAVSTKDGSSTSGSALGGALSGAAAGAIVGSEILPGWGTAIGAAGGAIAGAFM